MSECSGIDSILGGPMPKPYLQDLRVWVIETIEARASRREAAELYGISASVVGGDLAAALEGHGKHFRMREQGVFDPARLVFIDETSANTAMV
jgi:hypothetical protein